MEELLPGLLSTTARAISARALWWSHHRSGALLFARSAGFRNASMFGGGNLGIVLNNISIALDGLSELITVKLVAEYFARAALCGFLNGKNHGTLSLDTLTAAETVEGGWSGCTGCALDKSASMSLDNELGRAAIDTLGIDYCKRAHIGFSTCGYDHFLKVCARTVLIDFTLQLDFILWFFYTDLLEIH